MSRILIIGAKSDIAKAVAREYAKHGFDLILAARKVEELKILSRDIEIRFQRHVELMELNILDFSSHESMWETLIPKPEGTICVVGYMGDQTTNERDFEEVHKVIDTNYTGCVSFLNLVANSYEVEKRGFIVGISSVAGDRGRKANYIYGSAKAAFTTYLSGLRNRLYENGVQVLTVKPGYVRTKMTERMELNPRLIAEPKAIASDIFKAQQSGKNVLYTKWMWYYIMLVIKYIPEGIFKRLSI